MQKMSSLEMLQNEAEEKRLYSYPARKIFDYNPEGLEFPFFCWIIE